jgi:hypothetical protein
MEDALVQAQLVEYLTRKRYTLDDYRAGRPRVSRSLLRVLEEELLDLEWQFARADANMKKVLLDVCAGKPDWTGVRSD